MSILKHKIILNNLTKKKIAIKNNLYYQYLKQNLAFYFLSFWCFALNQLLRDYLSEIDPQYYIFFFKLLYCNFYNYTLSLLFYF